MRVLLLVLNIVLFVFSVAVGQDQSFCTTDEKQAYTYSLKLNVPAGNTIVYPVTNPCLVKIKEKGIGNAKAIFSDRLFNHDLQVNFSTPKPSSTNKNDWDIYLSTIKTLKLIGRFGAGKIDMNLSGLAIETADISSSKGDISLFMQKGMSNRIAMDSLILKTDMGSIKVVNIEELRAKTIIADATFGTMDITFGAAPTAITNLWIETGTNQVEITLPNLSIPVKVFVHKTPLADVVLPANYKEKSDDVYVSPSYVEGARNALIIHIDTSIGNVIFKVAK
jgi:hypothetical protein